MRAFAVAILPLVLWMQSAQAANYPSEMRGTWAALSDCHECPDRPEVAQRACDTYRANPNEVEGDIDVFEKNKRKSFGGEGTPNVARNISVKKIGPVRWKIAERYFNDHGGPRYDGAWQTMVYEATIKDGLLVIKEKDSGVYRSMRCPPQSPGSPSEKPKG